MTAKQMHAEMARLDSTRRTAAAVIEGVLWFLAVLGQALLPLTLIR